MINQGIKIMRYNVSESYLFIFIDFQKIKPRFGNIYHPWEDILKSIQIKKFECNEHRKVPGTYEDEIKYDGFIFSEGDSIWYNQYPRASYGQTTDDNDWRLYNSDTSDKNWLFKPYTDLSTYMSMLISGIQDLSKPFDNEAPADLEERLKSCKSHLEDLNQILREQFNVIAENEGLKIKTVEGGIDHFPNIPHVVFKELQGV